MDWNSSNDSFNFTDNFEYAPQPFLGTIVAWSFAVYLSIIVIAAIANVLLLFVIYRNALKCFRNPTTYFIANLGIADLLNSFFLFEELLVSQTTYKSTLRLPGVWGTIHLTIGSFVYFLTFPSVTALAMERYVSIVHPLWHQVKVTSRLCYVWIGVVWLVNCIYTGIFNAFPTLATGFMDGYPSIFYITTVFIYLLAFISLRKQRSSLTTDTTKSETVRRMIKLRLKNQKCFLTTVLIINVVLTFGIMPTVVGSQLKYTSEGTASASIEVLFSIMDITFFLNMAANPFLYIWRLPKYRKAFCVMYCCKK
jgi:hypothetical protein